MEPGLSSPSPAIEIARQRAAVRPTGIIHVALIAPIFKPEVAARLRQTGPALKKACLAKGLSGPQGTTLMRRETLGFLLGYLAAYFTLLGLRIGSRLQEGKNNQSCKYNQIHLELIRQKGRKSCRAY